jgi:hypothetical protein
MRGPNPCPRGSVWIALRRGMLAWAVLESRFDIVASPLRRLLDPKLEVHRKLLARHAGDLFEARIVLLGVRLDH